MSQIINLKAFRVFFQSNSAGGIILLVSVALSLLIANSSIGSTINELLNTKLGFESSSVHLKYSILGWINDGLMAIFFLLIGLEIKRELIEGELSSIKLATLPVIAALGGVILPALIYYSFNHNDLATSKGWGIPMATDIAFALGVLSLLGEKIPFSLKVFLSALAIVDDLLAILVIAIFYTANLELTYLAYAAGIFLVLVLFNKIGLKNLFFYLIPGAFIWYFIHHSGIHATIAGVLVAITLPTNKTSQQSPLEALEHYLSTPVNFIILPLFAFVNTNIKFEEDMLTGLLSNMGFGITLGLLIGKPLGICLMSWLAIKSGFSNLPNDATWKHMFGIGLLGGIGFTMSIFIALLSFDQQLLQSEAKFCILITSLVAGLSGYLFLWTLRKGTVQ